MPFIVDNKDKISSAIAQNWLGKRLKPGSFSPAVVDNWTRGMRPHTAAKHRILTHYLRKWFPILGKHNKRLAYIDGFAGQGVYAGGEPGSPIIALRAANEQADKMQFDVEFWFVEKTKKTAAVLESQIGEISDSLSPRLHHRIVRSTFDVQLPLIINKLKSNSSMPPTFAFVDPFGYSFKMATLLDFLKNKKCETLVTFMSSAVHRFTKRNNLKHSKTLDDLFNSHAWKKIDSTGRKKMRDLTDLYIKQLESGNNQFVKVFDMYDENRYPEYSLIFTTNNAKGLNAMSNSMKKVGFDDGCRFFDTNALDQSSLRQYFDECEQCRHPAEIIFENFQGAKTRVENVETFFNDKSRYIFEKKLLKHLSKETPPKIIKVVTRDGKEAKKFTYPSGCKITFASKSDLRPEALSHSAPPPDSLDRWF